MADSPFIVEVSHETFAEEVLAKSNQVPVLVDFWAAWCGPCQMLMPMLAKLVEEYQGNFLIAKVNSDEQQALAAQFGVRSLPTVKIFKNGSVVDEFMGVQPEPVIRDMIERHIVRASDHVRAQALAAYEQGQLDEAIALLEQAIEMDPANHTLKIDLAGIYAQQGKAESAEEMLQSLPTDVRQQDEVKALLARMHYASEAQGAPDLTELEAQVHANPDDLEARQQLAARQIGAGNFEPAMEQFLEMMKRDRSFGDDAGRQGLLAVFDMLGGSGELVNRYRRQMFNLLH